MALKSITELMRKSRKLKLDNVLRASNEFFQFLRDKPIGFKTYQRTDESACSVFTLKFPFANKPNKVKY